MDRQKDTPIARDCGRARNWERLGTPHARHCPPALASQTPGGNSRGATAARIAATSSVSVSNLARISVRISRTSWTRTVRSADWLVSAALTRAMSPFRVVRSLLLWRVCSRVWRVTACHPFSGASAPPPAARNRGRRPRAGDKAGAKRHEQCARHTGLGLIDEVDGLSDHVAGDLLIEIALRRLVQWLLLRGAPDPSLFSHCGHEGIVGWSRNPRSRHVGRRIDLVGNRSQRGGGRPRTRYFAHLLDAAPDTGGGQDASIAAGRQMH
jgi:hypothetical protein